MSQPPVEVSSPGTDQDLHQKVMVCLQWSSRKSAIRLAQELHQPKARVQRCLYQLESQGQIKKVDDKYWMLSGATADVTTPTPTSLVPMNTMAGPVVSNNGNGLATSLVPMNTMAGPVVSNNGNGLATSLVPMNTMAGPVVSNNGNGLATSLVPMNTMAGPVVSNNGNGLGPLERDILSQLSNRGTVTALQLAKFMGKESKKSVNPSLYTLKRQGLVRQDGSTWSILPSREGDSPGSDRTSEWPRAQTDRAEPGVQMNNYHYSISYHYGDQITNIQQHGVTTNNITGGAHGNCHIQVGSQNTMTGRGDPRQREEERATAGGLKADATETKEEGVSETGGAEVKEGEVSGTGTEFHIDIIADQLTGLQIGNCNQMNFCSDPVNEDPVSNGSASEDPFSENTEEE